MNDQSHKSTILKKCYRQMLILFVSIGIVFLMCKFLLPHIVGPNLRFIVLMLPASGVIWRAIQMRNKMNSAGITKTEWQEFCSRQPVTLLVLAGMFIFMLMKIFNMTK